MRQYVAGGTGVGEDDAFGGGVADVAFMPEAGVLERGDEMAAHHPRQAAHALGHHRVALVRHRRASLLLLAEWLERLSDLAPLQVANLDRDPFHGPCREC